MRPDAHDAPSGDVLPRRRDRVGAGGVGMGLNGAVFLVFLTEPRK